jgi:superfamily II RNA helicase
LKYKETIRKRDLVLNEIIEVEETMMNQYSVDKNIIISTDFLIPDKDIVHFELTTKGVIASNINEVHCLCFSQLIFEETLTQLNTVQLITVLSCFTNVNVSDDLKSFVPWGDDVLTIQTIKQITELLNIYSDIEATRKITTGADYSIHYDLIDYIFKWCSCQNIEECKIVIQLLHYEKDIELGDFIKALLKINNICSEFQKIGELTGNIKLLEILRDVPKLTLKYVATNQSLYI